MKYYLLYILATISTLMLFSCSDDEQKQDVYADEPLEVAVSTSWQCGRSIGATRAIDNPLGTLDGNGNSLQFPDALYPGWLHITLTDGTVPVSSFSPLPQKYLVKKTYPENDNYDDQKYIAYHDVYSLDAYKDNGAKEHKPFYSKSKIQKLNIEANTLHQNYTGPGKIPQAWDDGAIHSFGDIDHLTTKEIFGGSYHINRNHLFLDLGHATALLRLYFKVDEDYDKIRKIVLRSISVKTNDENKVVLEEIAGNTAFTTIDDAPGFLLTTADQFTAYCYMKPSHDYNGSSFTSGWTNSVSSSTSVTFLCTYDIYDKDEPTTADHCNRKNVTATNIFKFNNLKDSNVSTVTKIQAGYYYDLYITINPDYLYVLSEHDNKHMVIN